MNSSIKLLIGGLMITILQVLLAPIITINSIVPNFLLAFTIAVVVARPDENHLVFAFLMGIVYDLTCQGPVGAMAFVSVVVAFLVSFTLIRLPINNLAISIVAIVLSMIVIEIGYGIFQMALYVDTSFFDIFTYRVVPCAMYDIILGIIMFPIVAKIFAPPITANFTNDIDINSRR